MSQDETPAVTGENTELYAALFAVQGELDGVVKDSTNPHFKNDYADRTSILNTIRPLFQKHGLLLIQAPAPSGGTNLELDTIIVHVKSGQKFVSTATVPLPKADPQGYGSALTYTSRYSLVAILGIPLLDDDGNAGSGRPTQAPAQKSVAPKTATGTKSSGTAAAKTATVETSTPPQPSPSNDKGTASGAATSTTEAPKPAATEKPAEAPKTRKLWGAK